MTRPPQLWPRALREAALSMLRLLDLNTLGLGLGRQRTSLPTKIIPRAWRALEMGSPSKTCFSGLDSGGLLDDFDPPSAATSTSCQRLRPAASTAFEAAPTLSSAAARASPLRAPPVSFAPSQSRAAVPESDNSACDLFPAPLLEDGILNISIDPVFLAVFRVDNDFHRDSSTDTCLLYTSPSPRDKRQSRMPSSA